MLVSEFQLEFRKGKPFENAGGVCEESQTGTEGSVGALQEKRGGNGSTGTRAYHISRQALALVH